jgi:hypothetical protein
LKNDENIDRDFYQESEWRYIPRNNKVMMFLTYAEYHDSMQIHIENNKSKKHCSLKIAPKDITYIFAPTDSDIPKIITFIKSELSGFSQNDLMILYSRIVSIETLQGDM